MLRYIGGKGEDASTLGEALLRLVKMLMGGSQRQEKIRGIRKNGRGGANTQLGSGKKKKGDRGKKEVVLGQGNIVVKRTVLHGTEEKHRGGEIPVSTCQKEKEEVKGNQEGQVDRPQVPCNFVQGRQMKTSHSK